MPKLKTVKIREEVHSKLIELGKKGESFSDVIEKLVRNYKKK